MKHTYLKVSHRKTALPRNTPFGRSHKEDALQMILQIVFWCIWNIRLDILGNVLLGALSAFLGAGLLPLLTRSAASRPVLPRPRRTKPSLQLVPITLSGPLGGAPMLSPGGPCRPLSSPARPFRPSAPVSLSQRES